MNNLALSGSTTWYAPDYNPARDVLEHFDFATVQRVMAFLEWTWCFDGDYRVPTVAELRGTAEQIVSQLVTSDALFVATGGLVASRRGDVLRLDFIVEEAASHECFI